MQLQKLLQPIKLGLLILVPALIMACDTSVGVSYGYYDGYYDSYPGWSVGIGVGNHWSHRRPNYDYCRYGRCDAQTINGVDSSSNTRDAAQLLAKDFNVRYQSAVQILDALDGRNTEAVVNQIGVDMNDLQALQNNQLPSTGTIVKIANYLNEHPTKIKNMMVSYIQDMQTQR